jgi:hypothetical protein
MSPQSWRPSSSLSSYYNTENLNDKKSKTQIEKAKPEISKEPNFNKNNNNKNENKSLIVTKKSNPSNPTKTPIPTKLVSQSVDFKNSVKLNATKEAIVNKKLELKRHKTFISPTSQSMKVPTKS